MKRIYFYCSILIVFLFFSCATKEVHIKDEYVTTESGSLISKALKFEGEYKDEKYIFLRLYNVYYDDDYQIANLLKAAIAVLGPAPDGLYYTHVAISHKLNDDFIGMTTGGANNAKHESVMHPEKNRYLASNDKYRSQCTVIAIPCSEIDYENCKKLIEYSSLPDSRFYFGVTDIIGLVGVKAVNKHKTKKVPADSVQHKDSEPILNAEEAFSSHIYCCSAFCAYILMTGIQRYKDYAEATHFSPRGVTPADLYSIQGAQRLFNCHYLDYEQTLSDFIEAYPEFAEYL